ncbi:unnamed protein product [Gadus morhua 'NCC']
MRAISIPSGPQRSSGLCSPSIPAFHSPSLRRNSRYLSLAVTGLAFQRSMAVTERNHHVRLSSDPFKRPYLAPSQGRARVSPYPTTIARKD